MARKLAQVIVLSFAFERDTKNKRRFMSLTDDRMFTYIRKSSLESNFGKLPTEIQYRVTEKKPASSRNRFVVPFILHGPTKNTFRWTELGDDDEIGSVYLPKETVTDRFSDPPQNLFVEVVATKK